MARDVVTMKHEDFTHGSNNVLNIHKPMTVNGNDTTYKNGDDWGISDSSLFYPHIGLSLYELRLIWADLKGWNCFLSKMWMTLPKSTKDPKIIRHGV